MIWSSKPPLALPGSSLPPIGRGWVIRRRTFLALVGSAQAWPFAACGQQSDRLRRVAVVMLVADDASMPRLDALKKGARCATPYGASAPEDPAWLASERCKGRRFFCLNCPIRRIL
jgi:hypothetical protein